MTDERWEKVKDMLEAQFGIGKEEREELPEGGFVERVYFSRAGKSMKIERIVRPKVVGERVISSRRIGASARVEKEYSSEETVSFVKVYEQRAGAWEEISLQGI